MGDVMSGSTTEYGLPNLVPPTGITTSQASYDDGYYQKGMKTLPHYIDHGDGTVTDNYTGLMWFKQCGGAIVGPSGAITANNVVTRTRYSWQNSTAYLVGDMAYDVTNGTYWVCAVAHTSIADGLTWSSYGSYTTGQVVIADQAYWVANTNTGPIAVPNALVSGAFFPAGSYGIDTYWGYIYTNNADDTLPPTVSYGLNTNFNAGDIINESGAWYYAVNTFTSLNPQPYQDYYSYNYRDTIIGADGNYYWVNSAFYSDSFGFYYWQGNGNLTIIGNSVNNVFTYEQQTSGNWSSAYVTFFDLYVSQAGASIWSLAANSLFDLQSMQNPTWWSSTPPLNFPLERTMHPTYWVQLIWSGQESDITVMPVGNVTASFALVAATNAAGLAGHTDWRLPNINEYCTMRNTAAGGAGINTSIFTPPTHSGYIIFNSSSLPSATAYYVYASNGTETNLEEYGMSSQTQQTWLVRGG